MHSTVQRGSFYQVLPFCFPAQASLCDGLPIDVVSDRGPKFSSVFWGPPPLCLGFSPCPLDNQNRCPCNALTCRTSEQLHYSCSVWSMLVRLWSVQLLVSIPSSVPIGIIPRLFSLPLVFIHSCWRTCILARAIVLCSVLSLPTSAANLHGNTK